jgi:hypothetical protein
MRTRSRTRLRFSPATVCSWNARSSSVAEPAFTRARSSLRWKRSATSSREGVRGQIFIVGGVAMTLAYTTRRVTKDIDAAFELKSAIYAAAG